jgi:uncharacterized membrane protein
MSSATLFMGNPSWPALDAFAYSIIGLFLVLGVLLFIGTRGKDTRIYDARMAWFRAWMYFCVCWLLSWATGVLPTLLSQPLLNPEHLQQPAWWVFVIATWVTVLIGYLWVWPAGTVTYQRRFYPATTALIGVVWGFSEAQLFLAFWAIGERFLDAPWMVAVFTYLCASAANGPLHLFYWDRYVSPDHNIYEWNIRKVMLAHNPLLILSLVFLVVWGDLGVYLLWPAFALFASAIAQRFPAPWDTLSHGELEAQLGLCDVQTMSLPAAKRVR